MSGDILGPAADVWGQGSREFKSRQIDQTHRPFRLVDLHLTDILGCPGVQHGLHVGRR
jgi:hypothetical protein